MACFLLLFLELLGLKIPAKKWSDNPPMIIQRWIKIIIQLRVLPQILSQVSTNIQNTKKKKKKNCTKKLVIYTIWIRDAGASPNT